MPSATEFLDGPAAGPSATAFLDGAAPRSAANFLDEAPQAVPTSAWKEFFPAMFDLNDEQQQQLNTVRGAWADAKANGMTVQQMAERARQVSDKWDAIIAQAKESRPENVAMFEARRDAELRSVGVEPINMLEPVTLPKLTDENVHTLFPHAGPRAVNALRTGQNTVAGAGESLATPEGAAMFAPAIGPAIGKAFVAQMAMSVPEQLSQAAGHYAAGDATSGDSALINASATAAMLGMPLLAAKGKAVEPVSQPRPTADDWLPAPNAAPVPTTPESVQAQAAATLDPAHPRAAVLQVPGEVPPAAEGLQPVPTAQGTAWINPEKISAEEAQQAFAEPNGGGQVLGMASNVRPAEPAAVVTARDANGTPVLDEAVTPETQPAAIQAAQAATPAGGTVEVRSPENVVTSRIAGKALSEMSSAREPIPASLLDQAGVKPESLAEGYQLNAAGTAYEFAEPPKKLTPEQEMARESVQTMADLRQSKPADSGTPTLSAAEFLDAAEPAEKLLPVDVTPAEIRAASIGTRAEAAPDILDVIGDNFRGGVKFSAADHGDVVKTARGEAAAQMFTTKGEPADQVLKTLHEAGLYPNVQTVDDLAVAMRDAGEARIGQRGPDDAAALELAREQKRTQLFQAATRKPRSNSEPMPAAHFFKGDEFEVNGNRVRVVDQVVDAETGRPSHVEVEGAFGRQAIPADAVVHFDKGTLKTTIQPPEPLPAETPFNRIRSRTPLPAGGLNAKWMESNLGNLRAGLRGAPELRIVQSVKDLPERQRLMVESDLAQGFRTAGMFDEGKAWLIADHIGSLKEAKETYLEETLGHGGMEAMIKPQEIDRLYDLIRRGAPEKAAELVRNYGHDLKTAAGRAAFVGEFVAKASEWHLAKPGLWQRIADVMRRLAYRVGWLRNIAPGAILDAQMRGLARQAAARLAASEAQGRGRNRRSPDASYNDLSTGPRMSRVRIDEAEDPERQFHQKLQGADDISDALKGTVTNKFYERRPQEDDQAYAARIVQEVGGPDRAIQVFRHEDRLPAPVRMAMGMQILKSLDAAGRTMDAANFFDNDFAPHTTDVAQGLAMLNAWTAMSKDGKLDWARLKILRAANDALAPVRPDMDAAKMELQRQNAAGIERTAADAQVQAGAKEAITNAVINSDATHAAVVMELAQPWASSQFILDTARQHVGAKANELLNQAPRPPQFTPSQYLRAIMDDLAQRAAGIAASHYQGAEPGLALKDKLVQRLGIRDDAALKLANALDKEFAAQVKRAQEALPKRLAAQIERAKQGLPVGATETAVDRAIRKQLAEKKTNIGQIVREHWTKIDATGAELKDKLVKQGLEPLDAEHLADLIQKRFEALTARAKAAALEQLLKPIRQLKLAKPGLAERLVKLSNVGAFDDAKFWNAIRERLDLPEWTPALKAQLADLADRIGRIPAERVEELQRAQTDFLNAIERAKGVSNLELSLAFYMQNILSGLTTHVRVGIHTSAQMLATAAAETGQAIVGGRLEDIPLIYEALARGGRKALTQQKDVLKSGLVVGSKLKQAAPLSVLEQIHFGQKGGTTVKQGPFARALLENKAATLLNLWKYNARLITAQHMLYFKPAEEMKLALLAARQARTEGLKGRAAVDRARQMLGYGAAAVRDAEAQAIREGLQGTRAKMRVAEILQANLPASMKETARDYALRQTFLNDPYGFAGTIANIVASAKTSENAAVATGARVIVPFTRIAANLFNEGLNYTPIGAGRARFAQRELSGQKFADLTPQARTDLKNELYAKSALGTMLLTAVAFKAAQGLNQPNPGFTVYGTGPANPQDKATWRAAGGIPYTVKIGNLYLSYANTPGNVMFATLGNYLDGVRDAALYQRPGAKRLAEDLPMRAAAAMVGASKVIFEQPFLQSLLEVAQISGESNPEVAARGGFKTVARTASSFVVPNLLRQVDRFYDPTAYEQRSLAGILTSQVPFARQTGRPMLNALGQPIQSPVFGMFTGSRTADPLVQTLAQYNAWPSIPDRNRTAVNGVPLTDDEFYLYSKTRGTALANMLSQPAVKPVLAELSAERERLDRQTATATNPVAKARMQQMSAKLQAELIGKYEAAADKQAQAAVIRVRGY